MKIDVWNTLNNRYNGEDAIFRVWLSLGRVSTFVEVKSKIDIQFGKRIASLRVSQGISQEELAFRCGVHRTYIGALERGEKSPTLNTVEKIANGLNVPITLLFDD